MSIEALSWAFNLDLPSSGMKLTLLALANYSNEEGEAFPSQKAMAKKTCLCERAIRTHLATLEELNVITRKARTRTNGSYTSDLFKLNIGMKLPAADSAVGKINQRQILPNPAAESAVGQRQILPNPAAESAAPYPSLNTTITKTLTITKGNRKNSARAMLAALDVSNQTASDWLEIRKAKKLPLTKTALDGIKREAVIAGLSLEDALRISCEKGWAGFSAKWLESQSGGLRKQTQTEKNMDSIERAGLMIFGGAKNAAVGV